MEWFWYFLLYSFFGFLLEVGYARAVRSGRRGCKCFLLLPLCPVYGLGAVGVLALLRLAPGLWSRPLALAAAGAAVATAAEYLMALFYERALGVSFWDYSDRPANLKGRVCLPFSLAWGAVTLAGAYLVHPLAAALAGRLPAFLGPPAVAVTAADALVSLWLLATTHSTDSLRWYAREGETR